MITVIVDKKNNQIHSIYMSGHSGYSEAGSDIICSAASTLFITAINALDDICGLVGVESINEDGVDVNTSIILPSDLKPEVSYKAQLILETILVGFRSIVDNDEYKKYIELIESK